MKFVKVMFLHLSVSHSVNRGGAPPINEVCEGYVFTPVCQSFCSQGVGACVAGGVHGRGHMWQGDMCGRGAMCGRGHVWQGCHVWWGAMCGRGCACPPPPTHTTRYGWSMRERYASYWNAFLFSMALISGQTGEMLFIEDGHFYYLMKNLVLTSL